MWFNQNSNNEEKVCGSSRRQPLIFKLSKEQYASCLRTYPRVSRGIKYYLGEPITFRPFEGCRTYEIPYGFLFRGPPDFGDDLDQQFLDGPLAMGWVLMEFLTTIKHSNSEGIVKVFTEQQFLQYTRNWKQRIEDIYPLLIERITRQIDAFLSEQFFVFTLPSLTYDCETLLIE